MKLQSLAAASLAASLFVSCGDCCNDGQDGATSSSIALGGGGISAVYEKGSPEAAFMGAMGALKARKMSEFIGTLAPSDALDQMKAEWKEKRKQNVSEREQQEFQQFMGMLTADGAEEALFMMAKPKLAEAQQQLGMMAAMAPMMAAGAMEESGASVDAMSILEPLTEKLTKLDIASEDKCKEAISIVCTAARSMKLKSMSDIQKLDFDGVMGKGDIAFAAVMDVLAVYGISFDEALDSMEVKSTSIDGDTAQMEVTMTLFGKKTDPMPFEMVKGSDGRWAMPDEKEDSMVGAAVEQDTSGLAK